MMGASFADLEAYENRLFDEYNGEGRYTEEEFWADAWEELREED